VIDPARFANDVVERMASLSKNFSGLSSFALRELLGTLIQRVEGNMETKEVEITITLPAWALAENDGKPPMRLVGTPPSSASYETHGVSALNLGMADCRYVLSQTACYKCRRRPAA
jgi:hypothetical protein